MYRVSSYTAPRSPRKPRKRSPHKFGRSQSFSTSLDRQSAAHKRLIFLDVDGVLHDAAPASDTEMFCRLPLLAEIIERTGASVVLSSSWRQWPKAVASVSAALVTRGLPPLLGCTPSLLFKGRDAEIGAWLLANEASLAPGCRWIAIDDMLMPALQAHLVRTRPSGLRETDVLKAVDLLMFGTVSTGEPPPSDDGGFSGGASTHSRSSGTGSSDAEPGAAGGALTGSVSLNLRTWACRCDFCSLQSRRADQLASSPLLRLARRSAVM